MSPLWLLLVMLLHLVMLYATDNEVGWLEAPCVVFLVLEAVMCTIGVLYIIVRGIMAIG